MSRRSILAALTLLAPVCLAAAGIAVWRDAPAPADGSGRSPAPAPAGKAPERIPAAAPAAVPAGPARARNVILMVADGMGLADVTAARAWLHGPDGEPLEMERLEHVGYQRTHSASATVTDSAAAASAWACGEKVRNGVLCWRSPKSGRPQPRSVLEIARDLGRATGLVATSTITHATPAAFGAHLRSRECEHEIARQYVEEARVDVLLGGGDSKFRSRQADPCGVSGDFAAAALSKGYKVVRTKGDLARAVTRKARRLLGLFAAEEMTAAGKRPPDSAEPSLSEMTSAALAVLEEDPEGFFLMVEGSQVDWANHAHDLGWQIAEVAAFDEAVGVVLGWIAAQPSRRAETLLIVTADHETGGFAVDGPTSALAGKGERVEAGWTTREHTGTDTLVWSQGPQSERLARPLQNTDLCAVMRDAMR